MKLLAVFANTAYSQKSSLLVKLRASFFLSDTFVMKDDQALSKLEYLADGFYATAVRATLLGDSSPALESPFMTEFREVTMKSIAYGTFRFLIVFMVLAFATNAYSGNLIGEREGGVALTLGPPVPTEGKVMNLKVGGLHRWYNAAYANKAVEIEAVFLKQRCVGLYLVEIQLVNNGRNALSNTLETRVANAFLDAVGRLPNWQLSGRDEEGRHYKHRRLHYTATYNDKSLVIWSKGGALKALGAPLEVAADAEVAKPE